MTVSPWHGLLQWLRGRCRCCRTSRYRPEYRLFRQGHGPDGGIPYQSHSHCRQRQDRRVDGQGDSREGRPFFLETTDDFSSQMLRIGGAAAIAAKEDFVAEARASLIRAPAFSISGIKAFVASSTAACSSIRCVTRLIKTSYFWSSPSSTTRISPVWGWMTIP